MTIPTGVQTDVIYMEESAFGTAPGPSGGTYLRRVSIDLDKSADSYESDEIIKTYQVSDFRLGMRKVGGTLKGRLSPGSYSKFIGHSLRRDFAAGGAIVNGTGIAAVSGAGFTDAGNGFLTAGFKVGDVVATGTGTGTAGGFTGGNAANNGRYYLVTALGTGSMGVVNMNGSAATILTDAAGETVGISAIGKKTYVPSTGHTNKSSTIEKLFGTATPISELYTGCKVSTIDVSLPATGLAGIDFGFMGQNRQALGTAGYFTTPTAASTTGLTAAVNGVVLFAGSVIAVITGMTFKIDGGMSTGAVVGSNITPDVFVGRVKVSGQLTAYLQDSSLIAAFDNETEVAIVGGFTVDNTASPKFVSFVMPRCKLGGATKSDGEGPIIITAPFTALYNSAGGAATNSEQSTIVVQDSDAA
jgi:hypothetical protein